MKVKDFIEKHIKDTGYDGLYVAGECSCTIDNLMPCGDMNAECEFGYKVKCNGCSDFDYCIGQKDSECGHGGIG
jgi:hypothetical protein